LPVFLTDVPTDTLAAWVTAVHGGKELTRWAALAPPLQLAP
jgi:hypothetical protein